MPDYLPCWFLPAACALIGACIGSFLNVVIYRLPRNLSINEPKRSFCPACKKSIPWYRNIPVASWLILRGKCANCHSRISFRYWRRQRHWHCSLQRPPMSARTNPLCSSSPCWDGQPWESPSPSSTPNT
jgi:hypothetical protein